MPRLQKSSQEVVEAESIIVDAVRKAPFLVVEPIHRYCFAVLSFQLPAAFARLNQIVLTGHFRHTGPSF